MKIKKWAKIGLATIITLFVVACLIFTRNSSARVANITPITDQRWIISEIYLGDIDGNGAYMELYNNDDNTSLGWKDFVINLPFDVDLPPIFDLRVYKPHAYKTVKFDEDWAGWVAKYYVKIMYGDEVFNEIEDALDESPGYSYQRCQDTDADGKRILSDKFYYGKKSAGKAIECSDKSLVETTTGEVGKCEGLKLSEIGSNLYPEEQFIEVRNDGDEIINLADCYLTLDKEKENSYIPLDDYELEPSAVHELYLEELDDAPTLTRTTGIVYLLDNDHETVADYHRYREAKKDTSMAWSPDDNKWHLTYQMTPGEDNIIQEYPTCPDGQYRDDKTHKCRTLPVDNGDDTNSEDENKTDGDLVPCRDGYERNPETNRCRKIVADNGEDDSSLVPCKEGYERNPTTNRCRKIATISGDESGLEPCRDGYYRNPETNRCKKIASSSDELTPCREGYERNPATNRCVKVATNNNTLVPCRDGYERNPETNRCVKKKVATTLTPCKEGYERNPETNRCVKKKSTTNDKDADYPVKVDEVGESNSTLALIITLSAIGVVSVGILIWQYRHEIGRLFSGGKAKTGDIHDNDGAVDDWLKQLTNETSADDADSKDTSATDAGNQSSPKT